MFSGTSIISAIIANLCWTSFISSSIILKNVCISNDILLAGIVMLIVPLVKSVPDEENHRKSSSLFIALAILQFVHSYCQRGHNSMDTLPSHTMHHLGLPKPQIL